MAQLLNSTRFHSPATAVTPFSVTIPATTAGSKLVCVSGGGAVVTAKLGVGGTSFTKRTTSLGTFEVAAQDITDASGGITTIQIVLSGAENIDGMIYEFASGSLGNFIAGANQGGSSANTTTQGQASTAGITTAGASVIFSMFVSGDTTSTATRKFWGLEPLGKQFANEYIQNDPAKTKYWSIVGVTDQSAAGTFTIKSSRALTNKAYQAVGWAYQDLSGGTPTYANPYANAIEAENSLPGSLQSAWFGVHNNANIAGYTDQLSYLPGDTVNFKVDSNNVGFSIEIFRFGYYGHNSFGAKSKATVTGTPAVQSAPTTNAFGGAVCAWSTTATWTIPSNATPGVYVCNARRTDNSSFVTQIIFVVRSTVPGSQTNKLMICTADFTWQAYNVWGATTDNGTGYSGYTGRSIYGQAPTVSIGTRAFAVSFDRPLGTVGANSKSYFWDSEAALVNFVEGNGYDLAYFTMIDIDKNSTIPAKYTAAVSSGHSEYWSTNLRDAFENARDAGTNLLFFSSNTALWRVRFDPADTNRRTMICYKDSHDTTGYDGTTKYDPTSYTGTWRDNRTTPGGVNNTVRRPESGMTGQWFIGNGTITERIAVPNTYSSLPIWRNTVVATGATLALRGTNSASITTAGASLSISQPSATQLGDLVVVALVFNGSPGSLSTDLFRIIRRTNDGTNQTTVLAACYAGTAGTLAYSITWTGSLLAAGTIAVYSGAVLEDSNSSIVADTGGTGVHSTRSIANEGTGRWAVCAFADTNATGSSKTTSWTAGSGLTSRVGANTSAAASGPWSSVALMDTNGSVTSGAHQYSATAQFANPHAAAGIIYISPGTVLNPKTIGAEFDYLKAEEPTTPTNLVRLTQQPYNLAGLASDYNGAVYNLNGLFKFGMTMYKASSGALVFNAGSWRYAFGVSRFREDGFDATGTVDPIAQQAVINLLKDLGSGPGTLLDATAANEATTALVSPGSASSASAYGLTLSPPSYQTIFGTGVPTQLNSNDGTDYSLGTVFIANTPGQVAGARWYFPSTPPDAPVIATLYSLSTDSTGVQLAQTTFSNSQTGWNQVLFASPVAITANTKYVIAVWTSDTYTGTANEFTSGGVTNGALTAPQNNAGGIHNGRLLASNGSAAFPATQASGSGYFTDVLFTGTGSVSFAGWGIPMS